MSATLASFHCLRPWWLLLLLPTALLWWHLRRQSDASARWASVIDPAILRALTIGGDRQSRLMPHDVLLLAWCLGIVAVAGPTWQREPSPFADA